MRSVLLCSAWLGLSACGGGGGGGEMVRSDPPPPVTPTTPPPPQPKVVTTPNPEYSKHLSVTNTYAAHQAGLTGQGLRIGVVDSGVMRNHPALSPRVVANLTYVGAPNNLAIDDVVGHGTAVSQAAAGSAFGAWPGGIAPGAEIVSARIIEDKEPTDDGSGSGNQVNGALGLKAIHQDLINRGVRIMNNSWGGLYWTNPAATAPIADEYRPFIMGNNGLVLFATGNESKPNPSSMAALPSQLGPNGTLPAADLERGWIAVAAIDPDTQAMASYSNACGVAMYYCMVAPGTVVVTGTNDGPTNPSYWRYQGTSLATPLVSGAAALVWQAFPYFSNDLVRQTLLGTARDLGTPGVDATYGYGLLDVGKAVQGPSRFDWDTVTVSFDNVTSVWSNDIQGRGGLVKRGSGTLVLNGAARQQGGTAVEGGTLRIAQSLMAGVRVAPGGTLALGRGTPSSGAIIEGPVVNEGTLLLDSGAATMANYSQYPSGRLALMIGSRLDVSVTAKLDGNLHVIGVLPGYVTSSREVFLRAGSISGTFSSLTSAPNVLMTATLGYDFTQVWLDITRLDVTAAAQSMGLTAASVGSAQRIEGGFDAIDGGQLGSDEGATDFIKGAGAIQGAATAAAAERTLSSLSGELHNADTAFAMMAIESNRRALESRVDALQAAPLSGAWADGLRQQRAMSHFDVDADGWLMGTDARLGDRLTVGVALSQTDGYAYSDQRADREHNRQIEGQLYGAWNMGRGYLLGTLSAGRMQRWTQRQIVLGHEAFGIDADYADRYATAGLQAGMPVELGRARITPYAGVQTLQLERDGFSESGAFGFGLSTADSTMRASQSLLGARFATDWRWGSRLWTLQGRAEWQHLLDQSGGDIDARFTGLDVWAPIVGAELDSDVGVFGFGLQTALGRRGNFRFDVDSRNEHGETWTRAMATWSTGF